MSVLKGTAATQELNALRAPVVWCSAQSYAAASLQLLKAMPQFEHAILNVRPSGMVSRFMLR